MAGFGVGLQGEEKVGEPFRDSAPEQGRPTFIRRHRDVTELVAQDPAQQPEPLSESLVELGVPRERADNLVVVIAALEGAIILARIRRDRTPFDALIRELGPVLDGVVRTGAPGPSF
jgi:hypothetical protein